MADRVSDVNIEKGVHLSVVVELCVSNVIVVCFKNNGKEYRGVLMESSGGCLPFSFPFVRPSPSTSSILNSVGEGGLPCPAKNDSVSLSNSFNSSNNNGVHSYETPATTQRFSYNCDPFLVSPRPCPALTVVEMKPLAPRTKTVRDIRLRPRQTLCSNCKCAIHEGRKTRNVSHTASDHPSNTPTPTPDSRLRPRVNGTSHISSLHSRPPKRKSETQSPLVLLEDIKHKSTRLSLGKDNKNSGNIGATENEPSQPSKLSAFESSVESLTITTNRLRANKRSLLSETNINHSSNIQSNVLGKEDVSSDSLSLKVAKKAKSSKTEPVSKPSPTIKISIGAGAILKIPPRLPDSETCVSNSISQTDLLQSDSIKDSQIHKKAKKSARRAKDKDRHKSTDNDNSDSILPNGDQSVKSLKKHKKKHRHRHPSPEPSPEFNVFYKTYVDNNNESMKTTAGIIENPVEHLPNVIQPSIRPITPVEIEGVKKANSPPPPKKIKVGDFFIDVVDISESESDNDAQIDSSMKNKNCTNPSLGSEDLSSSRPRLLYTWSQDQGLLSRVVSNPQTVPPPPDQSPRYLVKTSPSILPVANSPHRRKNASPGRVVNASPNISFTNSPLIKDYPLRSRTGSVSNQPTDLLMLADNSMVPASEDSQSHSSDLYSHLLSDISGESGEEEHQLENIFSRADSISQEEDEKDLSKPLMLKIQTQNVLECVLEEGREIHVDDIVWGKIQGFPWWPGRVSSITVTQRDNNVVINQLAKVAWFGSNTMSHVHCCDLFPFLEDFKIRYNKKKKGPYKVAIKQATLAAQKMTNGIGHKDILDFSE